MGYRQPPHHIYLAYRTLTSDLGVGETEARHRLRQTFAGMPVDLVVQRRGDLTQLLQELTGETPPTRPDSGKVDKRTGERLLRELTQRASEGPENKNKVATQRLHRRASKTLNSRQ